MTRIKELYTVPQKQERNLVTALGSGWVEEGEGYFPQTFVMLTCGIQMYITWKVWSITKDTFWFIFCPQQKGTTQSHVGSHLLLMVHRTCREKITPAEAESTIKGYKQNTKQTNP